MAVDRRAVWLGGVIIVAIIGVMVVRSGDNPAPTATRQTPPRARQQTARGANANADAVPVDVNLERLKRERGEPVDQGRNPFRFQPKPAPVTIAPPPPPIVRPGNQTPGDPTLAPRPMGPPPPPQITLKFLGVVGKKLPDGRIVNIAVLSDGTRVYHGGEGEIVAGQYQILKIGRESIEMAYPDGRGKQTIRMSGQ